MKEKNWIYVFIMVVALWSCNDEPKPEEPTPLRNVELSRSEADVVAGTNDFAISLLGELNGVDKNNFVVSPLSVSMDFGFLANGANGNTLSQIMCNIIGASEMDYENVEIANSMFDKILREFPVLDNRTEINFANALTSVNKNDISTPFAQAISNYNVEVFVADGTQQTKINEWVNLSTRGNIREFALRNPEGMNLLNAMYFKGQWTDKFDSKQTKNGTFYGLTRNSEVPMMHDKKHRVRISEQNDFTSVSIEYGNKAYYLQLVLPPKEKDLSESIIELHDGVFSQLQTMFAYHDVNLTMPKFKIESKFDLKQAIINLGVNDAFGYDADFTGVFSTGENMILSDVSHLAMIDVDEEGVVVAAVTHVGVQDMLTPSESVVFDRPFLFFLREQSTGVILAMGQVTDL